MSVDFRFDENLAKTFLVKFHDKNHLKNWVHNFLGLDLPDSSVDPDSNSSPIEWMYNVYDMYRKNETWKSPSVITISSRESYKCVEKGSLLISKDRGLIKIEDAKIGETIWTGFSWQKINNWIDDGIKNGFTLTVDNGLQVTGSPIHRVWSWSDESGPQWKKISDLTEKDYIQASIDKTKHIVNEKEFEIGYLLGILCGDGGLSLTKKKRYPDKNGKVYGDLNHISLSSIDNYVINFWKKQCVSYVGREPRYDGRCTYTVTSKDFVQKLDEWGVHYGYSYEKTVPDICFTSKSYAAGFYSGLFDTDGTVSTRGSLDIQITSKKMLKQTQLLLAYLGVNSRFRESDKLHGLQKHAVSALIVNAHDLQSLLNSGVTFNAKKAKSLDTVTTQIPDAHDSIPFKFVKPLIDKYQNSNIRIRNLKNEKPKICQKYESISRDKLNKLCEWAFESGRMDDIEYKKWKNILEYKWIKVKKVEEKQDVHFFDLTVENDHSYWSNGIISHNTLTESILSVILMAHFGATICHMAAIVPQATAAKNYTNNFLAKMAPYLEHHGMFLNTQNSKEITIKNKDGSSSWMKIVVATITGANSSHSNLLCVDEVDTIRSAEGIRAFKEAEFIPGVFNGQHPLTIKTSTMKFPGGLFSKEMEKAVENNWNVYRWNIIDITEKCQPERYKPELPHKTIYVSKNLPLETLDRDGYNRLQSKVQENYEEITVMGGCASCKLAPVCKGRLAARSEKDVGGLWKPIDFVISQFAKTDPDLAEAQLMCFSGDVQVIMDNGVSKNISDIKVGEKVITHTGNVQEVTKTFKRHYTGKVFTTPGNSWKVSNPGIVTQEHPYFINGIEFSSVDNLIPFEFNKFGALKKTGDYLSLPINYLQSDTKQIELKDYIDKPLEYLGDTAKVSSSTGGRYIPNKFILNKEFGWIIGYFLAEGYYCRRSYGKEKRLTNITFCSDERETEFHDKVRVFAKNCGLTTSDLVVKHGHGYTIDIYSNTLSELFLSLCGEYSDKKIIHHTLMNANIEFLSGILDGFDAGDGTKRKTSYKELTTTSYQLASQLFLIAARLGLCPRFKASKLLKGRKQAYRITYQDIDYVNSQKRTKFINKDSYNLYRLDSLEKKDYTGIVYNIEVEGDNSYIANGVAVHNCWKPSSQGMVYPRFLDKDDGSGNTYTLKQAWERYTGTTMHKDITIEDLVKKMIESGVRFQVGGDWGHVHAQAFVVSALLPSGEWWLVDAYSIPGLEFDEILELALKIKEIYKPSKWHLDTAEPMFIKTFRKNGMMCSDFKKDVRGGIEAVRGQIINAKGVRKLKVVKHSRTKILMSMFAEHSFKLDTLGDLTQEPDDSEVADIADALRYAAQNMFKAKGKLSAATSAPPPSDIYNKQYPDWLSQKVRELTDGNGFEAKGKSSDGLIMWDFGSDDTNE